MIYWIKRTDRKIYEELMCTHSEILIVKDDYLKVKFDFECLQIWCNNNYFFSYKDPV